MTLLNKLFKNDNLMLILVSITICFTLTEFLQLSNITLPDSRSLNTKASFLVGVKSRKLELEGQNNNDQHQMLRTQGKPKPDEVGYKQPVQLALLMSFPNSGTSYTLEAVPYETNISCASNYGKETNGEFAPVFPTAHEESQDDDDDVNDDDDEGFDDDDAASPFWLPTPNAFARPKHDAIILTKTHCEGYKGNFCPSQEKFLEGCLSSVTYSKSGGKQKRPYSADLVKRTVHLIRDPLNNIVARYNHAHKHRMNKKQKEKFDRSPSAAPRSFRKYCAKWDKNQKLPIENSDVMDNLKNVPCSSDFFRYITWHNHAFAISEGLGDGTPSLVIHYEKYGNNWNETMKSIADILEQSSPDDQTRPHQSIPFIDGKTYHHFFTREEMKSLELAFQSLASPKTWSHLEGYFLQLDLETMSGGAFSDQ